jgi:shikimate kinase
MSSIAPNRRGSGDAQAQPRPVERIVLTGFMGSGKSTVGPALAHSLGWRFVDLDTIIEERDGRAVARIFAESGESAFRAMETDALSSSLRESRIVVALGGGALETPANRDVLGSASAVCVVLLTAEFDTLYERCQQQIALAAKSSLPVRPLLGDREAAAARLARREPIYRDAAHLILDTTGQQPEDSVNALLAMLRSIL